MVDHAEVVGSVIETINSLAGDWEYSGPVNAETRLIADLAMRSLDVVVLSSAMVRKYGLIPFTELYAEMEQMPPEDRDISIGDFADFVCQNATSVPPAQNNASAPRS
jgi:hypothetical protein